MTFFVKKQNLLFLMLSITSAIIVANRGNTRDTAVYFTIFKKIDALPLSNPTLFYEITGVEVGYGWYSYIMSIISNSPFLLFFIFSISIFITIFFISKFILNSSIKTQKLSAITFYTLLIYITSGYFAIQQFMQIRQGLAIPLALCALTILITYETKFKIKKYFIFVLLALLSSSMHQIGVPLIVIGIAIICMIQNFLPFSLIKFKIFSVFLLLVSIFITKFFLSDILISLSSRVETYSSSDEYSSNLDLFRLPNIKAFITYLLILIFTNEQLYKNKIYNLFYLLFILGLAFRIGFIDFSILSGRFATAFSFCEIFLLPFIFSNLTNVKIINNFLFFIFIIIQLIATYFFQLPSDFYESYTQPLPNL